MHKADGGEMVSLAKGSLSEPPIYDVCDRYGKHAGRKHTVNFSMQREILTCKDLHQGVVYPPQSQNRSYLKSCPLCYCNREGGTANHTSCRPHTKVRPPVRICHFAENTKSWKDCVILSTIT